MGYDRAGRIVTLVWIAACRADVEGPAGGTTESDPVGGEEFGEDESDSVADPPESEHFVLTRFDGSAEAWSVVSEPDEISTTFVGLVDGGAIVATRPAEGPGPAALVKFDHLGNEIDRVDVDGSRIIHDLAVDATGRIFVALSFDDAIGYAAYDADLGEHWAPGIIESVAGGVSRSVHVGVAPVEGVVFASATASGGSIRHLDGPGHASWMQSWPGEAAPEAEGSLADLAVTSDGETILVIDTGDAESGDLWLDAFDADGTELWAAKQPDTWAIGVAVTSSRTIVAAGQEILFDGDFVVSPWLAGYSPTGEREWELRLDLDASITSVRRCGEGFVLAIDGARRFDSAGAELGALSHVEPDARTYFVADAICPAGGATLLLGTARFLE